MAPTISTDVPSTPLMNGVCSNPDVPPRRGDDPGAAELWPSRARLPFFGAFKFLLRVRGLLLSFKSSSRASPRTTTR